jgi:hypothetical protein
MNRLIHASRLTLSAMLMFITACNSDGGILGGLFGVRTRGSGNVTEQRREVGSFDRIQVSHAGQLTVTVGDTETLTIRADDNIMPHIISEVRGGVLVLGVEPGRSLELRAPISYQVTVRGLRGLELSGASHATLERLETDTLVLVLSGASRVLLMGEADRLEITASGASHVDGEAFRVNDAEVDVSGASSASVWAERRLAGSS